MLTCEGVLSKLIGIIQKVPYCLVTLRGAEARPTEIKAYNTTIVPRSVSQSDLKMWKYFHRFHACAILYKYEVDSICNRVDMTVTYPNGFTLHMIGNKENLDLDLVKVAIKHNGEVSFITPLCVGTMLIPLKDLETAMSHVENLVEVNKKIEYSKSYTPIKRFSGGLLYKLKRAFC